MRTSEPTSFLLLGPSHFGFDLDGPKITRMTIGARM